MGQLPLAHDEGNCGLCNKTSTRVSFCALAEAWGQAPEAAGSVAAGAYLREGSSVSCGYCRTDQGEESICDRPNLK